jgi:hypothetical protein
VLGYVYAVQDQNLYVNLFMQSTARVDVNGKKMSINQTTKYPWNGAIGIEINPDSMQKFQLMIRIPGWVTDQPLPGDLYRFEDRQNQPAVLQVNGEALTFVMKNGYACIEREWKQGDKVQLDLPMPIRKIIANGKVKADRDKIALQRGPLVYCAEGVDNLDGKTLNLFLEKGSELTTEFVPGLLNGVQIIKGEAKGTFQLKERTVEIKRQPFLAIPYFAWANRGKSEMTVWFGTTPESTIPAPQPTLASTSNISALHPNGSLSMVNNQYELNSFNVQEFSNFNWWPRRDTIEWVQYDFANEESLSQSRVYWFDDGPNGDCRIPASWRILYRSGDTWVPVKNLTPYEVGRDRYCKVTFEKVSTEALRLEVVLSKEHSGGLYRWTIE